MSNNEPELFRIATVPGSQGWHKAAPGKADAVANPHGFVAVAWIESTNRPTGASSHTLAPVAGAKEPRWQGVHAAAPDTAAKVPAAHATHCVSFSPRAVPGLHCEAKQHEKE